MSVLIRLDQFLKEPSMITAVSMWGSFLFGSATGAFFMRLQWMTFKKDLLQELGEKSAVLVVRGSNDAGLLNETADGGMRVGELHTASSETGCQRTSPPEHVVALLEKKQVEIDGIRRQIQALRTVLPLLEPDPDEKEEGFPLDFSDIRLQAKYGSWFSPSSPGRSEKDI